MKSKRDKLDFTSKVVTILSGYPLDEIIKKRISRSLITRIEPDDIRQDVMLSILRLSDPVDLFRLHDNGGLRFWLIATVRNTVFGFCRTRNAKKRSGAFRRHADDGIGTSLLDLVCDFNRSPSSNVAAAEAKEAIQAALASLEPKHRRALKLLLEGHTTHEVAKLMCRPLASVRGFIRRGLEAMRGKMGAEANWFTDAKSEVYLGRLLGDKQDTGHGGDK